MRNIHATVLKPVGLLIAIAAVFGWFAPAYAATVSENSDEVILTNKYAAFVFDRKTLGLKQIKDLIRHVELLQAPDQSLFLLALWNPDEPCREMMEHQRFSTGFSPGLSTDGSKAEQRTYCVTKDREGRTVLTLRFLKNHFEKTDGTVDVSITVALGDDSGVAEWNLMTDNLTPLSLLQVDFPVISGIASNAPWSINEDYLITPVDSSQKIEHPRVNTGFRYFYPNCMSMQFAAYCDNKGGVLYYAAHDPNVYRKEMIGFCNNKNFGLKYRVVLGCSGKGIWNLPYPSYVGVIEGDWYDAAKFYRHNFADKTWKTFARRKDIAPWFADNGIWVQGAAAYSAREKGRGIYSNPADMDKLVERMLRLRNVLGEDFAFHWYVWSKHVTFDQYYPDYLPARADFPPAVTKLEAAGIHCMPYINSHYFDRNLPEWKDGIKIQESAIEDIVPGRNELKLYNMVTMCFGTELWRNRVVDIERGILHFYPVSALYLDEIGSIPELCYAKNHEHKGPGGCFYAQGQREVIRRIRETSEWGKRIPVIAGEGMSETHIGLLDGSISGHVDVDPGSLPVFQAVHSDRLSAIGLRTMPDDMKDMDRCLAKIGFSLVRGKQLGWFETFMVSDSFDLTLPEYKPQVEKLKECSVVRRAGKQFLFYGELLRPPAIKTGSSKIIWAHHIPFQKQFDETDKKEVLLPWVMSNCYRAPDGDIGIVLVNRTDKPQQVTIPWNSKDWSLKVGQKIELSTFMKGKWSDGKRGNLPESIELEIPAYTPALIKVTPVKP